jgi:hypothetical protein
MENITSKIQCQYCTEKGSYRMLLLEQQAKARNTREVKRSEGWVVNMTSIVLQQKFTVTSS